MNEYNRIIQGGAAEVLADQYTDECVDLVVTSPPYDDIRYYSDGFTESFDKTLEDFDNQKEYRKALNKHKKKKVQEKLERNNGYSFPFEQIAQELYRVMKKGAVLVWVVGDAVINGSETGSSFRQALYFQKLGFKLHDTMIYEKNGSSFPARRTGNRYSQIFEYMFVFSKGEKPKSAKLICDKKNKWSGWTTFGKTGSMRGKDGQLVPRKQKAVAEFSPRNNIWKYNTGKSFSTKDSIAFEHPAIFPEALAEDHILTWSQEGDVVLDPFVGSGTTTKMAHLNKRKWIGIDISEKYRNLAERRMKIAEQLLSEGYERKIETSSRDTITSGGKMSHKQISDLSKKQMVEMMLKWQDEIYELKQQKEDNNVV